MQLNFDIPIPFIPEPERKKSPREKKETVNSPQATQLDLLRDAPRKPEPVRFARPEHKPYEAGMPCMKDYFILTGAFLNWHRVFGAFSFFLSQADPSGKKERIIYWEGKSHKSVNYRWREFEGNSGIYRHWHPLYEEHLRGWTTHRFENPKRVQDYISERLETEK